MLAVSAEPVADAVEQIRAREHESDLLVVFSLTIAKEHRAQIHAHAVERKGPKPVKIVGETDAIAREDHVAYPFEHSLRPSVWSHVKVWDVRAVLQAGNSKPVAARYFWPPDILRNFRALQKARQAMVCPVDLQLPLHRQVFLRVSAIYRELLQ